MEEKKLYALITNNGDWGGNNVSYVIASSEEEAAEKNEIYKYRVSIGYDHYISEIDGRDLLNNVLLIKDCDKYNCKLIITEKGENK